MHQRPQGRAGLRRLAGAAGVVLLALPLLAGAAGGQEEFKVPDEFQGTASAAGISVVTFKQPNPLPVGPGAFATFEVPEVFGYLTANSSRARASLMYPGPAIAGFFALMCTAGATPACGQDPPPVLVEAEQPAKPDATLATDQMSLRDPSAPVTTGAASGEAHAQPREATSRAEIASYAVTAPDPARQAVVDALTATLQAIPGAALAPDPALISVGGGESVQTVKALGDGSVRAEARTVLNDIRFLAGAVTIDNVTVDAFVVTDGGAIRESGSSSRTSGLLVAGFPGSIGPEGFVINGQGDGGAGHEQLNGVAGQINDAVKTAVDKLDLEVRDGAATRTEDGTSAAADGLRISLANSQLTEASPPQVPQLCQVTGAIQDPLSEGGLILPPICAVPDVTGTSDSYEFHLGRASVLLTAQLFEDFSDTPLEGGLATVGAIDGGTPTTGAFTTGSGVVGGTSVSSTSGSVATGGSSGGGSSAASSPIAQPVPGDPGFLALEARWLGQLAGDRIWHLYLALAGMATVLLLTSRIAIRLTRTPWRDTP